jgi:hypothetical protein
LCDAQRISRIPGFPTNLFAGYVFRIEPGSKERVMGFVAKPPACVIRSDPATKAAWEALPIPLRECGEIAGLRLSVALSDALRQAADLLFSETTHALTQAEREAILDAAEFARASRERLVADFLLHFEKRYVRACQYKPTIMSGYRIDFDSSQLEVVKHDLLDDSLDPGMIAEAIQNANWGSLYDLTKCFGKFLGAEGIKPNDIPLSPRLIEAAVSDATRDQIWRHQAKYRLVRSLRRFLPERVGHLYRDLAEHMYPMVQQADMEAAVVSTPSNDQAGDGFHESLPVPDINKNSVAIDVAPVNEVLEKALAVARDEVTRRQVERPIPFDRSESVCRPNVLPALPDPVAPTVPLEVIQPIAQVMLSTEEERSGVAQAAALLAELESGAWLEFREADGGVKELKLAWISPRKSLYLMTNHQGERALSMSSEDLAAALRDDRARIVMSRKTSTSACVVSGQHAKKTA